MNIHGKNLVLAIKNTAGLEGPSLGLKIDGFSSYFLRPIPTKQGQLNPKDVRCLTEWRNKYPQSFLSEFIATDKQTSDWLENKVHFDDGRIAFMVVNDQGESVGYMGIAFIDWNESYVEADSIVSGANNPKGLMSSGLLALLGWAKGQLGLKEVRVRVLSDNPALSFYKKIGFVETFRVPLRKVTANDFVEWVEDKSLSVSCRQLVYHTWSGSKS